MSTSAVSSSSDYWITPTSTDTDTSSTKGKSDLSDFASFMKILSSELQNQDPTDPVSNTEYVAQLAQVESLSQLQSMNNSIAANSAYSLLGKTVTYETTDSSTGVTTTASGTVSAVVLKDSVPYITVNGETVKASTVQQVASASSGTSSATA
ncbi:MAG: flagellar hook capping FlgD N-terminal domain-containing protein [Veillonellales bacterium]